MKVEVNIPPNPSLLTSFLYEGLLKIRSVCPDDVSIECLNKVWSSLENKRFSFRFVRPNDTKSINKVLSLCKDISEVQPSSSKKNEFEIFIECLKNMKLSEISISQIKVIPGKRKQLQLVGSEEFLREPSKAEERGYSFQIMKAERYSGIASLEMGLLNKQVTLYSDLPTVYLFFLGLLSSLVTDVDGEYYFLLYESSFLPQVFKKPDIFIDIKDEVIKELSETLSMLRSWSEEIVTLSILFNPNLINKMTSKEIGSLIDFRLVRIKFENTYKVYNDVPLSIYIGQKIYEDKDLIQALYSNIKDLTPRASKFLRGKDPTGEGQHAYLALKYLYAFAITGNYSFLIKYYRELMEAYRASGGMDEWYLTLASRLLTRL